MDPFTGKLNKGMGKFCNFIPKSPFISETVRHTFTITMDHKRNDTHRSVVSEMTYTVSSGTLNPSIPYRTVLAGVQREQGLLASVESQTEFSVTWHAITHSPKISCWAQYLEKDARRPEEAVVRRSQSGLDSPSQTWSPWHNFAQDERNVA